MQSFQFGVLEYVYILNMKDSRPQGPWLRGTGLDQNIEQRNKSPELNLIYGKAINPQPNEATSQRTMAKNIFACVKLVWEYKQTFSKQKNKKINNVIMLNPGIV